MPQSSWKTIAVLMLSMCSLAAAAQAQMPEGPSVPNPDLTPNVSHNLVRIAYYASSSYYRYHGDYNLTYNIGHIGSFVPYAFADVDVEATYNSEKQFHPDRLVGSFELGGRVMAGKSPVGLYLRHMSSHNIDRTDRLRPAFEQIGARYTLLSSRYDVTLSLGTYSHRENAHYANDADIQGAYRLGMIGGNRVELDGDLHRVGESGGPRSSFTDYWVEPNLILNEHLSLYAGYGTIHDVDAANGKSDHPVIIGFKFRS